MIIAVDVDSTVADLTTEWLYRYNLEYGDSLTNEDLSEWSIHKLVKPECGEKIYDYLRDRTLYDNVWPYPGALSAIEKMRALGHRVIFVTSTPPEGAGCKLLWLRKHGFLPEGHTAPDYYECYDKSLIMADLLIDDGYHNVEKFKGKTILMNRPWNRDFTWIGRADTWDQVLNVMEVVAFSPQHPTEVRCPQQTRAFREILDKMYRTHLDKNQDYSPANIHGTGEIGLCTRTWDKMARLMNLNGFKIKVKFKGYKKPKNPKNESVEDSIMDLAVYCIIWLIYRRKAWGK